MPESRWNAIAWVRTLFRGTNQAAVARVRATTWTFADIRFDTLGWRQSTSSASSMAWSATDAEMTLTTTESAQIDDREGLEAARERHRMQARLRNAAIVSVEYRPLAHIRVLEVITKRRDENGPGYTYEGVLSVAGRQKAHQISIRLGEGATTGVREAAVSAQMSELNELVVRQPDRPGGIGSIQGWFFDPYDPRWDGQAENSITDDERLDDLFPNHPLSRLRRALQRVRQSIRVSTAQPADPARDSSTLDPTPAAEPRQLLSAAVVRELLWKANRFDLLEVAIRARLTGNNPTDSNVGAVRDLLMLGIVQGRQGRFADACDTLTRARDQIAAAGGRPEDDGTVATHLARALLELGKRDEADSMFRVALATLEANSPNDLVLGMALNGYGRLLLRTGLESDLAKSFIERADEIAKRLGGGQRWFLLAETAGGPAPTAMPIVKILRG